MELIKENDRETNFKFYLDDAKKVMLDFSQCFGEVLRVSHVRYLCDNVTALEEKDDAYYIGDTKYLDKEETKKYLNEACNELSNSIIKGKTYLCIDHCGKYENINKTYKKILDEIKLKNYKIVGIPTEQYIDGSWNKENEKEYVIKIMIPIEI